MAKINLALLILGLVPGCCRWGEKVSVGVFDAESDVPIMGAVVIVAYPETWGDYVPYLAPFRQCDSEAATGDDGIARVKVRGAGYTWDIRANEYGRAPQDITTFRPGELPVRYVGDKKILAAYLKHQNLPPRPPLTTTRSSD
jgi:hypothetical protein